MKDKVDMLGAVPEGRPGTFIAPIRVRLKAEYRWLGGRGTEGTVIENRPGADFFDRFYLVVLDIPFQSADGVKVTSLWVRDAWVERI